MNGGGMRQAFRVITAYLQQSEMLDAFRYVHCIRLSNAARF